MAKKSQEYTSKVASLIISKDEFEKEIKELIERASMILEMQVTPIIQYDRLPYGYGRHFQHPEYVAEEFEAFKKQRKSWIDFASELLKQSFDIPNNEYHRDFINTGQALILVGNEDILKEYKDEVRHKRDYLESLIEKLRLIPTSLPKGSSENNSNNIVVSKKVFIVHGHDETVRLKIEQFITQLGYEPVVLFKKPNQGATIIEKLERETNNVAFAIVLYTKCDEGKDITEESNYKPRARQNVVFEHGMMCGILGRDKVVALVVPGVEIPGDLSGIVYIDIDKKDSWKLEVAKEMKAAGLSIDLNKLL